MDISASGRWLVYPLSEPKLGGKAFDPRRGQFQGSEDEAEVPFFAAPSPDPEKLLPRTVGGGRFDFKTAELSDSRGKRIELRPGDQIEYYV